MFEWVIGWFWVTRQHARQHLEMEIVLIAQSNTTSTNHEPLAFFRRQVVATRQQTCARWFSATPRLRVNQDGSIETADSRGAAEHAEKLNPRASGDSHNTVVHSVMTSAELKNSSLPGADLVNRGLSDLAQRTETVEALLVSIATPRLRALGFAIPPAFDNAGDAIVSATGNGVW